MFRDFVKAIQKNLQQMSKDSSRFFKIIHSKCGYRGAI